MRLPALLRPPDLLNLGAPGAARCVAVPALGLSVRGWERTMASLSPSDGAVAVALPVFGIPAARGAALDPRSSAERLLMRLDDLRVERAVLLGHSASCQVVAEAARAAPGRVQGLVLVGPTTDPTARTWAALVRRWVSTARREPPWQIPLLTRDYTYSGLVGFVRAMDAARRHRLDDVLAELGCPVLLVRGEHDRLAPRVWLDRLAERSGRATVRTVPTAAHMVPLTHPGGLAAVVRPFLLGIPV